MKRIFTNICANNLEASKKFYVELLSFKVNYDSDWFVHLVSVENEALQLGLIQSDHEALPTEVGKQHSGAYLTVVVDDVDVIFEKAKNMGVRIIEPPTPMFYGQNRMLVSDPNGFVIDVSSSQTNIPKVSV